MPTCSRCIVNVPQDSHDTECVLCGEYTKGFDETALERELNDFLHEATGEGGILLEFSGGRHSTIALGLLRSLLDLPVVAVTLNNGFLPEPVLTQAQRICRDLSVRHIVVEAPLDFLAPVATRSRPGMAECCTICNEQISSAMLNISRYLNLHHAANGENKYRSLFPTVTARGVIDSGDGRGIATLNLPFAMRVNRAQGQEILDRMGWCDPRVPGPSSNCLIPWLSAEAEEPLLPGNPLFELLAAEVRCGYLIREEAFAMLENTESADIETVREHLSAYSHWLQHHPNPIVSLDSLAPRA